MGEFEGHWTGKKQRKFSWNDIHERSFLEVFEDSKSPFEIK